MGKNIFVGNIPKSIGEEELKELFEQKGAVDSVTVIRDNETGRSRGFAFVDMATEEDAQKAIEALNAYSLEGRNLTVNEARKPIADGATPAEEGAGPAGILIEDVAGTAAAGKRFPEILTEFPSFTQGIVYASSFD
jgi:cold-inducible RNA-binding protein